MRKALVIVLILFAPIGLFAQSNLVKGSKYVALKYGLSKYSLPSYVHAEFGSAFKEKMVFRSGVGYEYGNVGTTVFNVVYLNADYMYNLFDIKSRLFINGGLGAVGGLELIKSSRNPLKDQSLIYGARAMVEADYLIGNKWAVKAEFSEWYVRRSLIGNWYYTITLGVAYVIN
jgi:hypothetical protein